jgi:hypothetical protein
MGHEDASMTLDVYGHLIRLKQAEDNSEEPGMLSGVLNGQRGMGAQEVDV